ncbi:MAG TPA: DinB family protein [Candidatus Limnocylindrales bacterium]|nr:DinB family protein [Candidatus Limnocylindrales bacterium]
MRKADLLTLFDYMYWATQRILDAAEQLSVDEFVASSSVTTRDLRATLVHELDVEWSWRLNLQGRLGDDEADLSPDDYPDVAAIREHWSRDEADMRAWLEELSDELLAADVVSGLTDSRRPLWQYLVHIVTHAAQQQADAATLLSLAGRSPGELGFLEYLSTRA